MATMPALTADLYGTKHFGQNYAFMFSGYTCALDHRAHARRKRSGTYRKLSSRLPAAGALTCAGLVLVAATAFMAKQGKGAEAQRQKINGVSARTIKTPATEQWQLPKSNALRPYTQSTPHNKKASGPGLPTRLLQ